MTPDINTIRDKYLSYLASNGVCANENSVLVEEITSVEMCTSYPEVMVIRTIAATIGINIECVVVPPIPGGYLLFVPDTDVMPLWILPSDKSITGTDKEICRILAIKQ